MLAAKHKVNILYKRLSKVIAFYLKKYFIITQFIFKKSITFAKNYD